MSVSWVRSLLTQKETMRWPIFLNLVTALLTLLLPYLFERLKTTSSTRIQFPSNPLLLKPESRPLDSPHPFALIVILAAATIDSAIRMFITMNSEYYRQISYPEVAFGIIGAVIALQSMVVARISREMTERFGPNQNF